MKSFALDKSRRGCVVAKILLIELLSMDNGDSPDQGHGDDDDDDGDDHVNDLVGKIKHR